MAEADNDTCTCCGGTGWYATMERACDCDDGHALANGANANWIESRSLLLAAASAASGATTDLVEAARLATGQNFTRPNQVETASMLIDALRLTIEALPSQGDEMLLVTLNKWVADHA